jgi:hypothetical protein
VLYSILENYERNIGSHEAAISLNVGADYVLIGFYNDFLRVRYGVVGAFAEDLDAVGC